MAVVAFPHPFQSFYKEQAALKFFVIFVLAIICLIVILALDTMVKSEVANGYSSLEFAGSDSEAIKVVESWTARQASVASFSAGFHFIFMILYVTFLSLSTSWASAQDACPRWLVYPASVVALLQPVGGIFDCMLQSLNIASITSVVQGNGPPSGGPRAATAFAVIHDIILAIAVLISLVVAVRALCRCRRPAVPHSPMP